MMQHVIPGSTPAAAQWFRNVPGPVLIVDRDRSVLYANHAVAGLEPGELLGVDVRNIVAAEHRDAFDAAVADSFHPGLAHGIELPILTSTAGEAAWHHVSVSPLAVSGMAAALIVATDISLHHAETQRLHRTETLLDDTEGITHIGIWTWDISKPHADWSPGLYRIYGLDPARHRPTYQDYLTRVHPEDRERVRLATEAVFRDLEPYSHDERIRHADGAWRDLHTWAQPVLDANGKLVALMGVCQDITDRKQAERASHEAETRLRAVFDRSVLGIAFLGPDGAILEANAALAAMANAVPEGLKGRDLASLLQRQDHDRIRNAIDIAVKGGAQQCASALVADEAGEAGNKPVRVQVASVVPTAGFPSAGGAVAGPVIVAIVEDASLEERASQADRVAFARLKEIQQLEETSERRRQLLGMASHELKNPLTPVVLQLHMLGRGVLGPLNDSQKRAVELAGHQVNRMAKLLRDVLDMTRIEQSALAMHPVAMDAGALALRVVDDYRAVAAGWEVSLEADAAAGTWIEADPERIEQVLVNLVGNALKFTRRGGTVRVACRAGASVDIIVTDEGPGMDAGQLARLFKPFSQVHGPGQAREEGTGLGLFICKSIVDASGGTIEAASEPGLGATFTVRLPARQAPQAQ